jgi:aryl-alcohol dehydrogenase-like predicted oxidoreductase
MRATAEGTERYVERRPDFKKQDFYRSVFGLQVSSLGIGTYLGEDSDLADQDYVEALVAAGESGINFFDAAINYRNQRSERCIGKALGRLQRDEIVVCTKAGFLTPGAVPDTLRREDVVGGMHSMAPHFLEDQIERSRANLGVDCIDVFYLHNPETQLNYRPQEQFEDAFRHAIATLERLVERGSIRWYGAATWDGFRKPGLLNLPRMAALAAAEGGPEHHFRFIQLPFNLGMVEAFTNQPRSVLEQAREAGIAAVASGTLLQGRVLAHMPDQVAGLLPGLDTSAQRGIQFTRSTPGISVALVGMGRKKHVMENLGVARVPPAGRETYLRLYQ